MRVKSQLRAALLFLTALALPACAARPGADIVGLKGNGGTTGTGSGGSVGTGAGGASGVHCTTTACVPALATDLTWDAEIAPSTSSSAAFTQLTNLNSTASGRRSPSPPTFPRP